MHVVGAVEHSDRFALLLKLFHQSRILFAQVLQLFFVLGDVLALRLEADFGARSQAAELRVLGCRRQLHALHLLFQLISFLGH